MKTLRLRDGRGAWPTELRAARIARVALGSMFVAAGAVKALAPMHALGRWFGWPRQVGPRLTRLIGASELAGGLGLVVPTSLTPLAAAGLETVMALAAGFHLGRRESERIPIPTALGAIAAWLFWREA